MSLLKFFSKKEPELEDLVPGIEKLIVSRHLEDIDEVFWGTPNNVYIYNGYLIAVVEYICNPNKCKYYIYNYKEDLGKVEIGHETYGDGNWRVLWGRKNLIIQETVELDKRGVFLAAFKKVDDIILATEGF